MFTGNLSPISPGETYQDTLELRSDDDGVLVAKSFLDACTKTFELFRPGETAPAMTATVTVPSDGIITFDFGDTSRLCPGIHRVRGRLTKDGVTDDVIDATLPVLP